MLKVFTELYSVRTDRMTEGQKIKILLLSNNFKYYGNLVSENENFIIIYDLITKSQMTFPKSSVVISREVSQ
jgi:hypothetical protein